MQAWQFPCRLQEYGHLQASLLCSGIFASLIPCLMNGIFCYVLRHLSTSENRRLANGFARAAFARCPKGSQNAPAPIATCALLGYTVRMANKFSAVAFDLDGTLYPNRRLYRKLLPFVAANWRLLMAFGKARWIIRREQEKSPSLIRTDFYDYQAALTAEMLNAGADAVKEKIEALMYRGWEPLFSGVRLFPHVRDLLPELRAAGLKLGLLSDFPPEAKLKNMGLAGLWDSVLCSEETGALKPSAHPFLVMAGELGCPPEKILYVGNSRPYDVAGAQRAGMKAALISRRASGSPRADFTFQDYRQLRDFVLN